MTEGGARVGAAFLRTDDCFAATPAKSAAVGKICLLRYLWEKDISIKSEKKIKR